LGLYFGLLGVGSFWKGKRIIEVKNCWREKNYRMENAKEGLIESMDWEFNIGFRKQSWKRISDISLRKAKKKKRKEKSPREHGTVHSASLRMETLRVPGRYCSALVTFCWRKDTA
jgi:hypothetical protein